MASLDTASLPEELAKATALRERFTTCCLTIGDTTPSADGVAGAIAQHLAETLATELPAAAQIIWHDRILRPLKADVTKPLAARAIGQLRSWPSARVAELARALTEIEAILVDHENEVHHEVIYAEISRTYS